ncbi:MAG: histidine phosphatase family protein [Trueperaceae bacterium]|nr:histidine phosphatase family protein [Trueperaceae bacterium]
MKLYLIRHGETDWELMSNRGVKGMAASLAPLTEIGRLQIATIANDFRLEEAEAVLCSSYARALESAALISRKLNKPLFVEYDLHEWLPQKDPLAEIEPELMEKASEGLSQELMTQVPIEAAPWESLQEVRDRVIKTLVRYKQYSSLIVVTHAVVISSLLGEKRQIDYAEIVPYELKFEVDELELV